MNQTRRQFLGTMAFASATSFMGCKLGPNRSAFRTSDDIRAVLLHLGYNMWKERQERLALDESRWDKVIRHMVLRGMNMLVVDIGEGLRFPSHPELAIEGSWNPEKMQNFIAKANGLGLEVVPKLNFSACHDGWLGQYHRMVSTSRYYEVVKDVVRDAAEIFGNPRLFHLGWDEEVFLHQKEYDIAVIRGNALWWHDFLFTVGCAEAVGCRAWVWSDYGWTHPEYVEKCPKSVMQSNWYYDDECAGFDVDKIAPECWCRSAVGFFAKLEKAGFDQIPCGTNWVSDPRRAKGLKSDEVIGNLVRHCRKVIARERLKGFMLASWKYIVDELSFDFNVRGVDLLADALDGSGV